MYEMGPCPDLAAPSPASCLALLSRRAARGCQAKLGAFVGARQLTLAGEVAGLRGGRLVSGVVPGGGRHGYELPAGSVLRTGLGDSATRSYSTRMRHLLKRLS